MKTLILFFASLALVALTTGCSQSPSNPSSDNSSLFASWPKAIQILGSKNVCAPEELRNVYNGSRLNYNLDLDNNNTPIPYREKTLRKYAELNRTHPENNNWTLIAFPKDITINETLEHAVTGQKVCSFFTFDGVVQDYKGELYNPYYKEFYSNPIFYEPINKRCLLINMTYQPLSKSYLDQEKDLKINHPEYQIATASIIFHAFLSFGLLIDQKHNIPKLEAKKIYLFTSSVFSAKDASDPNSCNSMFYLGLGFVENPGFETWAYLSLSSFGNGICSDYVAEKDDLNPDPEPNPCLGVYLQPEK